MRAAALAGFALAALAGCGRRADEAVACPTQDARISGGSVFVRYVTNRDNDEAVRWMRDAGCIDGWIELAPVAGGARSPAAEDDLVAPSWGVVVVRYEREDDWRTYPLDAWSIAIGRLPDRLLPLAIVPGSAPAAWTDLPSSTLAAGDADAKRRLERLATMDLADLGLATHDALPHPTAWLDARGAVAASPDPDGALLVRCVSEDGWRTDRWLRVPIALLDAPLSLTCDATGLLAVRQRAWLARFAAPPPTAVAIDPLPASLLARTVPVTSIEAGRWVPHEWPRPLYEPPITGGSTPHGGSGGDLLAALLQVIAAGGMPRWH